MKKVIVFLGFVFIGAVIVSSSCVSLQAAIPASERAVLIALYNATNGDNWSQNDGWKTPPLHTDGFAMPGTEDNWFGISLSGDHVAGIDMYSNILNGSIPPELGNLSNLDTLDLADNLLGGSIPPELGNLYNLTELNLNYNQLSGSIPPELGNLGNLYELTLSSNYLSGSIPLELENLSNLSFLVLSYNQLSGSIPPELGNLGNLYELALSSNHLSGSIPPELGNLSNLAVLYLNLNQLMGSIPSELGNLSSLHDLDLNSNNLSLSIPPELGNLSNLAVLYLSFNQLSGSIPPELGNLSNLTKLYLSYNELSGNIPSSLIHLTELETLTIAYNCLYTNDPELKAWLSNFEPGWESEQCGGEKAPPFGSFDTPVNGSTVYSSIPVTGWALDDTGVDRVKIYREQNNRLVYIGDAAFVEGARPDVAALYPGYPDNSKAGWGYMMLTNFLPNNGNGTFVIHAVADDFFGKTTTLGTKTITVDNANAEKPFGAIETPTQGGTASGGSFINWGWVLTPQPNTIPTDGSTIDVIVDGVNIGHPVYNNYRADIAGLFPSYNNSNGAVGYFYLDTTAYENGVHTIQWTAEDNAGNSDGIGSRYFTIQNAGESRAHSAPYSAARRACREQARLSRSSIRDIPIDYSEPVRVRNGYKKDRMSRYIYPDDEGRINVEIKELEPVEIHLTLKKAPSYGYNGYLVWEDTLRPLPIGSTLDASRGVFYWSPGPGFVGCYRLVFIDKDGNRLIRINIIIAPRNS